VTSFMNDSVFDSRF